MATQKFKTVKRWWYYWKLSRKVKKHLKWQIERCKKMGPAEPPTPDQVEEFKKELDLGWDSHMIQKIENKRTYFEADIRI